MQALVTGATSGIGQAVARSLAAKGWAVALVGRRADRLATLAGELDRDHGVNVLVIDADVSSASAEDRLLSALSREGWDSLDAAILAAGHGRAYGPFREGQPADIISELETNLVANVRLSRVLISLTDRAEGTLVFVGSVFGYVAKGSYATYCASKTGLLQFARALRDERREGSGTRICTISPGTVRTEFASLTVHRDPVVYPANLWSYEPLEPEDVSRAVCWVLDAPRHVEIRELVMSPAGEIL